MAVVQISRIQVRRGKANSGSGLPQLASGELAWAVDSQQLYIGNGAVAEGAPAVGNTKILTENDLVAQGNILNLIKYIYKVTDSTIQTGPTNTSPITRFLQERLDDRVNVYDFGVKGDNVNDDTQPLQRAIWQLYLNASNNGVESRVQLDVPAGTYKITSTIYIPAYVSLVGTGPESTVIRFSGTGPTFETVSKDSHFDNDGNFVVGTSDSNLNKPVHVSISNMKIFTNTNNQTAIRLKGLENGLFRNLIIEGVWGGVFNKSSRGIELNNITNSSAIACTNNIFTNVTVTKFSYGIYSRFNSAFNIFENCKLISLREAVMFGGGGSTTEVAASGGPTENTFKNCYFEDIKRQAVFINAGTFNSVVDCRFNDVGNNGGGNGSNDKFPQIYFYDDGNIVTNLRSDRHGQNSKTGLSTGYTGIPYVPEVAGPATYSLYGTRKFSLTQTTINDYQFLFRLPMNTSSGGVPFGTITYSIDYVFSSASELVSRKGTITITADFSSKNIQLSDDYVYTGADVSELSLTLKAMLLDETGIEVTGALDSLPFGIALYYTNSDYSGDFRYSYTSQT